MPLQAVLIVAHAVVVKVQATTAFADCHRVPACGYLVGADKALEVASVLTPRFDGAVSAEVSHL